MYLVSIQINQVTARENFGKSSMNAFFKVSILFRVNKNPSLDKIMDIKINLSSKSNVSIMPLVDGKNQKQEEFQVDL